MKDAEEAGAEPSSGARVLAALGWAARVAVVLVVVWSVYVIGRAAEWWG